VLGTLLRRGVGLPEAPMLPQQVEERWQRAWGDDVVRAARMQIARRPSLDLCFADDAEAQAYAAANSGVSLAPKHVRLDSASVSDLPGFGGGRWWVQDLASSLPARLIPEGWGEVLDLCAAPGGKTMQLAAAGHDVTAVDASGSRLERLRQNLDRTHLNATLVEANALTWAPDRQFDAILLDAPCSATGTFRRHPEILYRARGDIIASSAELQSKLIARAAQWLKPGGALIYAVCSLEPEEGEQVVEHFLATREDYALEEQQRILPGAHEAEGGADSFFIARLVRNKRG
jgi:16S rRNA (cytosine967-C5)-methyltransferase